MLQDTPVFRRYFRGLNHLIAEILGLCVQFRQHRHMQECLWLRQGEVLFLGVRVDRCVRHGLS